MLIRVGGGLSRGGTGISGVKARPGVGAAMWAGPSPTVSGVTRYVQPGLGQAQWTGPAPSVALPVVAAPGVGAASWTGYAPTVSGLTAATQQWSATDASNHGWTLTDTGRTAQRSSSGAWKSIRGDTGYATGKRYVELYSVTASTNNFCYIGLANAGFDASVHLSGSASSVRFGPTSTAGNGITIAQSSAGYTNLTLGKVIGIAVDFDGGKIWFSVDNTWLASGNPASGTTPVATFNAGTTGALYPAISAFDAGAAKIRLQSNSGEQTYSPPSGFSAWV